MRISKKTREQAATACQLAASNSWIVNVDGSGGFDDFAPSAASNRLACRARAEIPYRGDAADYEERYTAPWAEAEALLRTGWEP